MDKTRLLPLLAYGRVDNVLFRAGVGFASRPLGIEEVKGELNRMKGERASSVVFPSHFFEFDGKRELLSAAREMGLNVWIQISPGAELSEFFPWILENTPLALEIVIDRPLYPSDLEKLDQVKASGGEIRFVFCPTREIDPLAALANLPKDVLRKTSFYFGVKRAVSDSFLGADEIFTFLQDVRKSLLELELKTASYLRGSEVPSSNDIQSNFRFSLDPEYYQRHFDQMGGSPRVRRLVGRLGSSPLLRLPLLLSFYGLWLLRNPLEMLADFRKRCVGFVIRIFWICVRVRDIFHRGTTRAYWAAFWAQASSRAAFSRGMVWIATSIYWSAYRVAREGLGYARRYSVLLYWRVFPYPYRLAVFLYWTVRSIFSSPAWFLREKLPFVYWIAIFPFQKIYWFIEFQMRKRVLK